MNKTDVEAAPIPYWRSIRRHDIQHEDRHYGNLRQYGSFFVVFLPLLQREGG